MASRLTRTGDPIRPSTRRLYEALLRLYVLAAWSPLANLTLAQLTPPMVRRWDGEVRQRTGRTRAAHAYRLLRSICATAVADGLLRDNPANEPARGREPQKPDGDYVSLSVAEVAERVRGGGAAGAPGALGRPVR